MNGHQPLIAMRQAGYLPGSLTVIDGDCAGRSDWQSHVNPWTRKKSAEVVIAATDQPELLDLRFAYGLVVQVSGWRSLERAKRLHKAFIEAKAAKVITAVTLGDFYRPEKGELMIYDGESNG